MRDSITRFMWGYQPHFRMELRIFAEDVLKRVDDRFEMENCFLVGIHESGGGDGVFPACVEPESDWWIDSEHFEDMLEGTSAKIQTYPDSGLIHVCMDPRVDSQGRADRRLLLRALRDLARDKIREHPSCPRDQQFYVSWPVQVGDFLVMCVLGIPTAILNEYPSLAKTEVPVTRIQTREVTTSLVDAIVKEILERAEEDLSKPDPGSDLSMARDGQHLLRDAGNRFCQDVVARVDHRFVAGPLGFFRNTNEISATRYEKEDGAGRIVLAPNGHPGLQPLIRFKRKSGYSQVRGVRKLLQLCSKNVALHTDSESVFGLAVFTTTIADDAPITDNEDIFVAEIVGHHLWELQHNGEPLMRVRYGLPELPRRPFDERKLRSDLLRIFRGEEGLNVEALVCLFRIAERERHGTLVIVSSAAEEETARLSSQ